MTLAQNADQLRPEIRDPACFPWHEVTRVDHLA